jgi:cytochrome c-type biogenesis protein
MQEALPLGHLALSLVAGGLTTLSPCVFPILPLVLGGAVQRNRLAPLAMGLGMAMAFTLVGLLLGAVGPALNLDSEHVRTGGALLMMVLGLVMLIPWLDARFSRWMLPIATSANKASTQLDSGSLGGAWLLGAVLGLVWSPCSGPLLASALTLVASEGGAARGALVLGVFGIGAATPLVAVAYASRSGFASSRGWILAHVDRIKKCFGLLILLVGVSILSGADRWLEARIVNVMPEAWVQLTTGL